MSDDDDEAPFEFDGDSTGGHEFKLRGPDPPLLYRPLAMLCGAFLCTSLLLYAVTSTLGIRQARHANIEGDRQRADLLVRVAEFESRDKRASEIEQAQQDCRDGRTDSLLRLTSEIVGDTAHLFSQLAAGEAREQMQVTIDRLEVLAQERDVADALLSNAIAECRNAVPGGS